MATPVPPLVPTSAMPLATDSDAAFDAKAFPALASLNPFGVSLEAIAAATATNADAALAAALGGDLPALTGNAGKFLRVNAGATAAEFAGAWERGGAPGSSLGDFNLLTESGIYTTSGDWANEPLGEPSRTVLVVSRALGAFKNILQMVTVPTSTTPTIYTRVGTGDPVVWSDWELMITSGNIAAEFNATGTAPLYACRAWVNFNGTGTVAIRASGNVSSITDNGVGDYTVNFTTAMPDVNYSAVPAKDRSLRSWISALDYAAGSVRIVAGRTDDSASYTDMITVSVAIFR